MATIADVARNAGVSVNTVSRYLNRRGYMSEKTKHAVHDAIEALDYHPNQIARSLSQKRSRLIGLVIPDVGHPFFSTMTLKIEDQLYRRGYRMILCDTMHSSEKEKQYLQLLMANQVDGVIIGSHSINIDYTRITAPVVALDRDLSSSIPVVAADHRQGGLLAARAFVRHGCRKVIQLTGFSQVRTPSNERYEVFQNEMERHHITCITKELRLNQFELSTYQDTARKVLESYPDADGIFAADAVAAAFQRQIQASGRTVPDDVFIFAYDGTYITDAVYPSLPCVVQPFDDLARTIVDVLIRRIKWIRPDRHRYTLPVSEKPVAPRVG